MPDVPLRVLVVDDVPELRQLLRGALEEDPRLRVVGEAGDGARAVEAVVALRPAAVVLDIAMPGLGGLEALPRIRELAPDTAVVVLSSFERDRMEGRALACGADRYVVKGTPLAELRTAVVEGVRERRRPA